MKTMIKFALAFMVALALFSAMPSEAKEASIVIDGKRLENAPVLSREGSLYLPLRKMGEAVGARVAYKKSENHIPVGIVTLSKGSDTVDFIIDNYSFVRRNDKILVMNQFPFEENGKSYLPLRTVSDLFGYDIIWDNQKKTVFIDTKKITPIKLATLDFSYQGLASRGELLIGRNGKYNIELAKERVPRNIRYQSSTSPYTFYKDYWSYLRNFYPERYSKEMGAFILEGLNEERKKRGISPLIVTEALSKASEARANEVKVAFSNLSKNSIEGDLASSLSLEAYNKLVSKILAERQAIYSSSSRPNGKSVYTHLEDHGLSYNGASYDYLYGVREPVECLNTFLDLVGTESPYFSREYRMIGMATFADRNLPYLLYTTESGGISEAINTYSFLYFLK